MMGFGPNALKTDDITKQEVIEDLLAEAEANDYITFPLIDSLKLGNFGAKNFRVADLISDKSSGGRGPNSNDKTAWKNSGIKQSNPTVKYYKVD